MKMEDLKHAYDQFFDKSEAGQHLMKRITEMHQRLIEQAQREPENARDLMQQARGLNLVVGLINLPREGVKKDK